MGEKEELDHLKWFKMETARISQEFKKEREKREGLHEVGLLGFMTPIVPQPKPMNTNVDYLRMSMPKIIDDFAAIALYYSVAASSQGPLYLPMDTLESMNFNINRIYASGRCSSDLTLFGVVKNVKELVNDHYESRLESTQRLKAVHAAHCEARRKI